MRKDRVGNDKPKQHKVIKIVGTTGALSVAGIINYIFEIITPAMIVGVICFILICLIVLQDSIGKYIDRICKCIENVVKEREKTKQIVGKNQENQKAQENQKDQKDQEDQEDCKIYEIKHKRKGS